MPKKNFIAILMLLVLAIIGCVICYQLGKTSATSKGPDVELRGDAASASASGKKSLDLICDLKVNMPQSDLSSPRQSYTQIVIANIDFTNLSGWYQGQFAISESRKGSVTMEGSVLHVRRPALFPRFGVMISGEEFTIDRATGAFLQNVSIQDGRTIELMSGFCGKYTKAPF